MRERVHHNSSNNISPPSSSTSPHIRALTTAGGEGGCHLDGGDIGAKDGRTCGGGGGREGRGVTPVNNSLIRCLLVQTCPEVEDRVDMRQILRRQLKKVHWEGLWWCLWTKSRLRNEGSPPPTDVRGEGRG
jgi:hypothetical protein